MKTPTLRDVAEHAGVSISIASRVLNEDPATRASESTRARVTRAATQLGYRPNVTARALKSARTNTIGVVAPDLNNALFSDFLLGIEDHARQAGYAVLLGRAESLFDNGQVARMIEHGRVDGFILQGRDDESPDSLLGLVSHAPSVLVHGRVDHHPGSVMINDVAAARVAVQHLVERGHRRIGLVNGVPGLLTAELREEGFRRALRDHGLRSQSRLITRHGYYAGDARSAVDALLASGPRPTGLVVANVNAGLGVLTALRDSGLAVPDDVSVVAIHDSWVCDHSWPPLTTVRTPLYEMGSTAVRLLLQRLAGEQSSDIEINDPTPHLIERQSVRSQT